MEKNTTDGVQGEEEDLCPRYSSSVSESQRNTGVFPGTRQARGSTLGTDSVGGLLVIYE